MTFDDREESQALIDGAIIALGDVGDEDHAPIDWADRDERDVLLRNLVQHWTGSRDAPDLEPRDDRWHAARIALTFSSQPSGPRHLELHAGLIELLSALNRCDDQEVRYLDAQVAKRAVAKLSTTIDAWLDELVFRDE